MGMTLTQKIVLIALLVLGGLCLIVGFTLMHYIGGFLRTVEEEKSQEEASECESDGRREQDVDEANNNA